MPNLSEAAALSRLVGPEPITYHDLDDIFKAFGVSSTLVGNVIWYSHGKYDIGDFRCQPLYDLSTVPEAERAIVWKMIDRLRDLRDLEAT
jgi:hypothetical protein